MASKFPWLKLGKKTDPEIPLEPPIWFGNKSNGEYFRPQTPRERSMREEILKRADREARHHGMDRREFLASSMGMAVTLTVINEMGCNSSNHNTPAAADTGTGTSAGTCMDGGFPIGTAPYVTPPTAACAAGAEIGTPDGGPGNEFIFDVQTHCFDNGEWRTHNIVYPQFLGLLANCTDEKNSLDCLNPQHYAELFFLDSETTMTVITSWPAAQCYSERSLFGNSAVACGLPLSNDSMRVLRDWINAKAMSQRCINQVQVMPNDFLEHQIEGMYAAVNDPKWKCGSWKAYPAWRSDSYPNSTGGAQGYYLSDPVGIAFIEAGLKLGVPNFAIHKGLPIPGFDVVHNQPWDIGKVASMFPQANFVVYHSAINAGTGGTASSALMPTPTEGVPYPGYMASNTPTDTTMVMANGLTGVNQLIQSLLDNKVIANPDNGEPFKPHNVYAEMGSAWSQVMTDTTASQHYIGKLIKYLGPSNVCWGTDCILSGSPQAQISAFRAFTISEQFQEMYKYPALTQQMKAQIFGLNAAGIYRINPTQARCKADANTFTMLKRQLDEEIGGRRWTVKTPLGPRTLEEYHAHAREMHAKGIPG